MNKYIRQYLFAMTIMLTFPISGYAENFRVRLFFGLSIPEGGKVSVQDWETFQKKVITKSFKGFNVVDSIGYYKGKAEPSKIVTLILDGNDLEKAEKVAKTYAKQFKQDSVMMVVVKIDKWVFVKK